MTITLAVLTFLLLIIIAAFISYKASDKIIYRKTSQTRRQETIYPSQFNIPFKDISFKNKDGISLKGWFIPSEKQSQKTIVFMHGWGMDKSGILPRTLFLREQGYNLFYFDFRGSGESGEGLSSIGYLETEDAASALDKIRQIYPQETKEMGLYGLSMGAAVAVYTAAHDDFIKCLVAEGCYYSYKKVVARWARVHKHAPYFPLVAMALFFARKRLGMNPENFSPRKNIKELAGKAIFIINGADDALAPRHDARKLFRKASEPKQLWIVPNASHTEVAEVAGNQYQTRLSEFFTKYL
ncbi:MAG: alpha/beta fold hydrolase [Elusimicrobiota bacterium]|jgi:pimeloyl-ACP methyl ester carboxylesterase|nr:alpha/beta fold hydrolase [Elusimicrobiota bacterium]